MPSSGKATRLTVFLAEDDLHGRRSAYHEIVHRAREAGLAGASVLRGIAGFGASATVRTTRIMSLSETMPIIVVVVDADEKIRAFLPQLDGLVSDGLVLLDEVEVLSPGTAGDPP